MDELVDQRDSNRTGPGRKVGFVTNASKRDVREMERLREDQGRKRSGYNQQQGEKVCFVAQPGGSGSR